VDVDGRHARRGQEPDVRRPERPARRDEDRSGGHVLVGPDDAVARRHRPSDLDRARHGQMAVLQHQHGVGARGQRPAGRDLDGAAGRHLRRVGAAHDDGADHVEIARQPVGGAVRVGGPHGPAVHRRAGEAGQVVRRPHVARRHAAVRGRERDRLGAGTPSGPEAGPRLGHRADGQELAAVPADRHARSVTRLPSGPDGGVARLVPSGARRRDGLATHGDRGPQDPPFGYPLRDAAPDVVRATRPGGVSNRTGDPMNRVRIAMIRLAPVVALLVAAGAGTKWGK
jgi:hypothetical protein